MGLDGGNVYGSNDFGQTWSIAYECAKCNWYAMAASATGEIAYIGDNSGYIYVSKAYGVAGSWMQGSASQLVNAAKWHGAATDSTGYYAFLSAETGIAYFCFSYLASCTTSSISSAKFYGVWANSAGSIVYFTDYNNGNLYQYSYNTDTATLNQT